MGVVKLHKAKGGVRDDLQDTAILAENVDQFFTCDALTSQLAQKQSRVRWRRRRPGFAASRRRALSVTLAIAIAIFSAASAITVASITVAAIALSFVAVARGWRRRTTSAALFTILCRHVTVGRCWSG